MQIYMQDIYPDWPYNEVGLQDYLKKVQRFLRFLLERPTKPNSK
jgi:hypothetical protein